jgi:hypothetical protein
MNKRDADLHAIILNRVKTLRELPLSTLEALPEYQGAAVELGGREQIVATWRQTLSDGRTLIVVQAKHDIAFGVGFMHAVGFVVTPAGSVEDPEEELMWEYT